MAALSRRDRLMRQAAVAALLFAGVVAAATIATTVAMGQFRAETRAVLVDVSVTVDGPVRGLREEDFELRVGGERTDFRMLDPESLTLAVLFAMDVSASTAGDRRRRLADGARRFAEGLTSDDSCAVVSFSTAARFVREFAPCGPDVGAGLLQPAPGGATALWDGFVLSLAALHHGGGRPVLLVFTDGQDNLSGVQPAHLRRAVAASEALIYAIVAAPPRALRSVDPDEQGARLLRDLTATTGGRTVTIRSDEGLGDAYEEILADLRVRYVLAFTPDPELEARFAARPGAVIPIEVRLLNRRRGARVRTRTGYAP